MNRSTARQIAIQLCYACSISTEDSTTIVDDFFIPEHYDTLKEENPLYLEAPDAKQLSYIKQLVNLTCENKELLESYITKYSKGWKISRISKTALGIIKCAMCEILYMDDIPNSVSVNEAVEHAKKFEEPETVSFINGILGNFIRGEIEKSNDAE